MDPYEEDRPSDMPTYYVICARRDSAQEFLVSVGLDPKHLHLLRNRDDSPSLRGCQFNPPLDKQFTVEPSPSPADVAYLETMLKLNTYKDRVSHCEGCGEPIMYDLSVPNGQYRCNPCQAEKT